MGRTVCIVQARLGSSRLPAKVLLPLPTGRTVLEEVLFRCKQITGVDVVVCAIPDTAENDIVAQFAERELRRVPVTERYNEPRSHCVVRGPEHDILARYAKAAELVGATYILRVTADCPLIDPSVCQYILKALQRSGGSYLCNNRPRRLPLGLDCEAFSRGMLDTANAKAILPDDREHVGTWMAREVGDAAGREIGPAFIERITGFLWVDASHLRWTLDTLEDYVRIWGIFQEQMGEAA